MSIVTASGLTKRWGDHDVLVDTEFTIDTGVTGLLGANGSGKTTLFGMFLGLHPPTSGQLEVLGLDPRNAGDRTVEAGPGALEFLSEVSLS